MVVESLYFPRNRVIGNVFWNPDSQGVNGNREGEGVGVQESVWKCFHQLFSQPNSQGYLINAHEMFPEFAIYHSHAVFSP